MDKKTLTARVGVLQALLTRELKPDHCIIGASETAAETHVFPEGRHPAILSNAERVAKMICHFGE